MLEKLEAKFSKGDKVRLWGLRRGRVVAVANTPGAIYAIATGKPVYRYRVRWHHASESGHQHAWVDEDAIEPWDDSWLKPVKRAESLDRKTKFQDLRQMLDET
jgi:hypothetical protein